MLKKSILIASAVLVVLVLVLSLQSRKTLKVSSRMLGVWQGPAGRTIEITGDKWLARSGTGLALIRYRVVTTDGAECEVALVDDASGFKGTATMRMNQDGHLQMTASQGEWVVWTNAMSPNPK